MDWVYSIGAIGCKACRVRHRIATSRSLGLCPGRAVSAAIARSPPSSPDPLLPPAGEGEARLCVGGVATRRQTVVLQSTAYCFAFSQQ
jgi:hypothetical protein